MSAGARRGAVRRPRPPWSRRSRARGTPGGGRARVAPTPRPAQEPPPPRDGPGRPELRAQGEAGGGGRDPGTQRRTPVGTRDGSRPGGCAARALGAPPKPLRTTGAPGGSALDCRTPDIGSALGPGVLVRGLHGAPGGGVKPTLKNYIKRKTGAWGLQGLRGSPAPWGSAPSLPCCSPTFSLGQQNK